MNIYAPMPAPIVREDDPADYHRARAMKERLLADEATDAAARRVHAQLATLHDQAWDAVRAG